PAVAGQCVDLDVAGVAGVGVGDVAVGDLDDHAHLVAALDDEQRDALGAAGRPDEVAGEEVTLGDDAGVRGADGGEADLDLGALQLGPGDADLGLGVDDLRLGLFDPGDRGAGLGAGGADGRGGGVLGGDGGVALFDLLVEQALLDGAGFVELLDAEVG